MDSNSHSNHNINYKKILEAYSRIQPFILETPVLTSSTLSTASRLGVNLYFKCEFMQKTGSFKARGACNATLLARDSNLYKGVCTHSSGNHAQALAWASSQLLDCNLPSHIIMPYNAPKIKKEAVIGYGGIIYECEPTQLAREQLSHEVSIKTNSLFIHPSENENVICGQGTIAVELLKQIPDLDAIIVPIGGGGLISGIATAAKSINPSIMIIGAEPHEANDAYRSKQANTWLQNENPPLTIADGLKTSLGTNTWPIVRDLVDEVITVTESEIINALRLVWYRMKCLIEPSAAVGVAVALSQTFTDSTKFSHLKKVGVILCGGNVDIKEIINNYM